MSYPNGAVVAFRVLDDPDEDREWAYECLVDEIVNDARIAFPSLQPFAGWRGREDRILLRNAFADCGASTYCGLAAIWLAERDYDRYWEADYRQSRTGPARHWIAQAAPQFVGLFGELRMIGRFSNGEAIFERASTCN